MNTTNLMRVLGRSQTFSKTFSEALDEALNNGTAKIDNDTTELNLAKVGNDVVVEDVVNDELTKFSNTDGENVEMEAITVDGAPVNVQETIEEDKEKVESKRFSPKTKNFDKTLEDDKVEVLEGADGKHIENTIPEVEVTVDRGIEDPDLSGTKAYSIKMKGLSSPSLIKGITRAISKAFSDSEMDTEVVEEVTPFDLDKEEVKEDVKVECDKVKPFTDEELQEKPKEEEAPVEEKEDKPADKPEVDPLDTISDEEIKPKVEIEETLESKNFSIKTKSKSNPFLTTTIQ